MATNDRWSGLRLSNRALYADIFAFLVGLFIGLVVLGWWLWPVQWTNSYPQYLIPPIQEDYVRMAVDSYSVNGDVALAEERYNALGPTGPSALAAVEQAPEGQDPADIQAFAEAVGAPAAAADTTPAAGARGGSAEPATPAWQRVLAVLIIAAIVVAALVFFFLWRARPKPAAVAPPAVREASPSLFTTVPPASGEPAAVDETPPAWAAARQYPVEELETSAVKPVELVEPVEEEAVPVQEAEPLPEEVVVIAPEMEEVTETDLAPAEEVIAPESEEEVEPVVELVPEPAEPGDEPSYAEEIGDVYSARLIAAGISSPEDLLARAASRLDREELAEATGISTRLLLRWVKRADLYRVKGISGDSADLLDAAGVDTIIELAQSNPINLHLQLMEINEQKDLMRQPPSLAQVQDWVLQAKQLPRIVTY